MIYITYRDSVISDYRMVANVWEVDANDVEEQYVRFMKNKADEINVVINGHWLNIMNMVNHHPNLTEREYKSKEIQWDKIRDKWTIDKFIEEKLNGNRLDFNEIHRF